MLFNKANFSKKQIIGFIGIAIIILAIPFTIFLTQQRQIFKNYALQSAAQCTPDDGSIPGGYSYTPGALEIYVSVIETNEAVGPIPGVYLRADKLGNNEGTGVNAPRNRSDGAGCGFSAEGITDGSGHVNLEPLNCNHNNFKVSNVDPSGKYPGGLPPDVVFDSQASTFQPDGNDQNNVYIPDISNLPLGNGYAGILKLYYRRKPPTQPTPPVPTPCYVGKVCSACGGTPGTCQPDCNGGWCNGGSCSSCSPESVASTPTPTPTSTPLSCPVPNTVTNIRIDCPYCP